MKSGETPPFLTSLGKSLGGNEVTGPKARLRNALLGFRDRAATLAGEIHRDLPEFTVHDITHLDALWEMAELVAGPDYPLNPLEVFALGGAILLHDLGLGLAAWPDGRAGIKTGLDWQDALINHLRKHLERAPTSEEIASPPSEVEQAAVEERLRLLHAKRAEELAFVSFKDPKGGATYFLIDDPDLRHTLGPLLGRLAHSHWWLVSGLPSQFGTIVGALPDCPADWTLDPLKIAALLRTADAAHLDARRAPGFLRALRRPGGISRDHWVFQEHLLKPRIKEDRLVYTTAQPFMLEESEAWWLCHENLRMVDSELRRVDALLADLNRPRLRARGVAGVESTILLQDYIKASGWTPVDARIHISNVADIVKRLGGEYLYGRDATVPLRELIQNASDAVRARRLLQDRSGDWGRITVRLGNDEQGRWIEVEDTGIGMSEAVLKGPLLDFGTTYWGSMLMREEHEGLWAKGFEPTGRYGIGFFSVFMWGHRVRVTTRPYLEAVRSTQVLEFRTGLEARPLLRPASSEEQIQDGGTRVRVWLSRDPDEKGGLLARPNLWGGEAEIEDLGELCEWLAPALDVDLYVEDVKGLRQVVAASDWLTMDGFKLIARVGFQRLGWRDGARVCAPLLRVLQDPQGQILGRAAIFHEGGTYGLSETRSSLGVITVGGLRAQDVEGIAGIFVGSTDMASRHSAEILADESTIASWASEQARLIAENVRSPVLRFTCASSIVAYGGNPDSLPIAKKEDSFVDFETLARWEDAPDEVALFSFGLGLSTVGHEGLSLHPHVLGVHDLLIFKHRWKYGLSTSDWIRKALARTWGCSPEEIEVYRPLEKYEVGIRRGVPEEMSHDVIILKRPYSKYSLEATLGGPQKAPGTRSRRLIQDVFRGPQRR